MVQGYASKHRKWMATGIFILLYSVAILVDSSLFTKLHLPRYYDYIRYHVKTEIFPKHYFTFIFILCFEVAFDWLNGPTNFFNETLRCRGSARQGTQVRFTLCLFDQSWNHKTKNKLYYKQLVANHWLFEVCFSFFSILEVFLL